MLKGQARACFTFGQYILPSAGVLIKMPEKVLQLISNLIAYLVYLVHVQVGAGANPNNRTGSQNPTQLYFRKTSRAASEVLAGFEKCSPQERHRDKYMTISPNIQTT